MKIIVWFYISIAPFIAQGQAQHTTMRKNRTDNDVERKEKYQVLSADQNILDGKWQSTINSVTENGFYRNGKRDSAWTVLRGDIIIEKKYYTDGKRTGIWEFFDYNGKPQWKYDFNLDTISGPAPLPLTSAVLWNMYLVSHIHFPAAATAANENGDVVIAVTVGDNGWPEEYSVYASQYVSLNEEALRLAKGFEYEFVPAKKNGKNVSATYLLKIGFRQQ